MRRLAFLGAILTLAAVEARAAEPAKLRVLLTYGGHGFQQKEFFAMFDAMPGVTYTKAEMPKAADLLKPGLQKDYDLIVMYDMAKEFTPEQQKNFVALLEQGMPLVAMHHNIGAHNKWAEYPKIIGGRYFLERGEIDGKTYPPSKYADDQDMKITVADKTHPITQGIEDFDIHDEAYGDFYTSPKAHVLLKTDHPKNGPNVAWVNEYGKSRVFYLMLGHDSNAWKNPAYPKILFQGMHWAAGK